MESISQECVFFGQFSQHVLLFQENKGWIRTNIHFHYEGLSFLTVGILKIRPQLKGKSRVICVFDGHFRSVPRCGESLTAVSFSLLFSSSPVSVLNCFRAAKWHSNLKASAESLKSGNKLMPLRESLNVGVTRYIFCSVSIPSIPQIKLDSLGQPP